MLTTHLTTPNISFQTISISSTATDHTLTNTHQNPPLMLDQKELTVTPRIIRIMTRKSRHSKMKTRKT